MIKDNKGKIFKILTITNVDICDYSHGICNGVFFVVVNNSKQKG